jgi:hypothetical protein
MIFLIIIIDRIVVESGELGMGVFVAIVYVLPISILGCLIGEIVHRIIDKIMLKNTMLQFFVFTMLGFGMGLIILNVLLYENDNMTIPLISALGSVTFFVGRNSKSFDKIKVD